MGSTFWIVFSALMVVARATAVTRAATRHLVASLHQPVAVKHLAADVQNQPVAVKILAAIEAADY